MKQDQLNSQLRQLSAKAQAILRKLQPYSLAMLLVFVGCMYGFLLLRTYTLNNKQPSEDAINSQVQAARLPRIDPSLVQQLQSLRDNSVNVQTLFDRSRNNPFQ